MVNLLIERVTPEPLVSAETKLIQAIEREKADLRLLGLDAPLRLPVCLSCALPCPGAELCDVAEIRWMRDLYLSQQPQPKTRHFITPFVQRPVEAYWASQKMEIQEALGANTAPFLARAAFLSRRLKLPLQEVAVKLSAQRLGEYLKLPRIHWGRHRNSIGGAEARMAFLKAFQEKLGIFFYHQDFKFFESQVFAFDSLIVAISLYYYDHAQVQPRPLGFPSTADWIAVPYFGK